jgi:hypothetical protein
MNNTMPLCDETLNFVENLLRRNLVNEGFNYSIYVNRTPMPYVNKSKDIEEFEQFVETVSPFTKVVDITMRTGKANIGQRITLTSESLDGLDVDASKPMRNNSHTVSQQQKHEDELVERVEFKIRNEFLQKEIKQKEEEIERLKKENGKQVNDLRQAEEYSREVEKVVKDMHEKGAQGKKSVMDYAMDFEKIAPGVIGKVLGMGNDKQPDTALSGTPQQQVDPALLKYAEIVRDLLNKFTQQEFEMLLEIIRLLENCKEVMPQFRYNIQVYLENRNMSKNVKRTEATPQATARPKAKPVENSQSEEPQQKTVAKPIVVENETEEESESEEENQQEKQGNENNDENEFQEKGESEEKLSEDLEDKNTPPDTM